MKKSKGNFEELIYNAEDIISSKNGDVNRIKYRSLDELKPCLKSHKGYFTDLLSFQHFEVWLSNLSLKNGALVFDDTDEKTPLMLSTRIASNYQKLFGVKLHLGSAGYKLTDFETNEDSENEKIFTWFNSKNSKPSLVNSINNRNGIFSNNLFLSMKNNFLNKDLFEVEIEDKDIYLKMLFETRWKNFENCYAEVLNSGEEKYPIRNFTSKRWLKFIEKKSFLKYRGKEIDLSKLSDVSGFVDEAYGFANSNENWDWMIFKSENGTLKKDVRLIIGKECLRAGHSKTQEDQIATLFVNGKMHRLKGTVTFDYTPNNLESTWRINFSDPTSEKYKINVETEHIAPKVEKSFMNFPVTYFVDIDLQRIVANTKVNIILEGKKYECEGIGSFESNTGISRRTKYFKD